MMLKKLLLSILLFNSLTCMQRVEDTLDEVYDVEFESRDLQNLKLYWCYRSFVVEHNDKMIMVNKGNMDSKLKNITEDNLRKALKEGYISMSKIDIDKYHLKYNYNYTIKG